MATTSYHMVGSSSTEEEEEMEDASLSHGEFAMGVLSLTEIFLLLSAHNQYLPKPDPLLIQLHHFSVSNFTVTDGASKLDAVWDADVTLTNPNIGSDGQVTRWQSFVCKRGEVVSCAMLNPISIRPMKRHSMRIRFDVTWSECGGDGDGEVGNVVEELRAEKENGTVRLEVGMKMVVQKSFSPDRLRMWQPGMATTANCSTLSLAFLSGSDQGTSLIIYRCKTQQSIVSNVPKHNPTTAVRCLLPPQSPE